MEFCVFTLNSEFQTVFTCRGCHNTDDKSRKQRTAAQCKRAFSMNHNSSIVLFSGSSFGFLVFRTLKGACRTSTFHRVIRQKNGPKGTAFLYVSLSPENLEIPAIMITHTHICTHAHTHTHVHRHRHRHRHTHTHTHTHTLLTFVSRHWDCRTASIPWCICGTVCSLAS